MKRNIDRREFLKRSALMASGLAGALYLSDHDHSAASKGKEIAVVEGQNPPQQVRAAINQLGGIGNFVRRGDRVVLLPNPQGRTPGASTNPDIVAEVVRLCLEAGAANVTVSSAHGPGRWSPTRIIERVEKAGGKIKYPESSRDWITVKVSNGRARKELTIIRDALENDALINLPVFKQHESTGVTGTLKNLMGFNSDSGSFHQGETYLHKAIVDLASVIPPHLCIVDATTILIENGPFGPGRVAHPKKVFAGTDRVALDSLCCSLLKVDPRDVLHIRLAHESGLGKLR